LRGRPADSRGKKKVNVNHDTKPCNITRESARKLGVSMFVYQPFPCYPHSMTMNAKTCIIIRPQGLRKMKKCHALPLEDQSLADLKNRHCSESKIASSSSSSTTMQIISTQSQPMVMPSLKPLGAPFPLLPNNVALSKLSSNAPFVFTCLFAAAATAALC